MPKKKSKPKPASDTPSSPAQPSSSTDIPAETIPQAQSLDTSSPSISDNKANTPALGQPQELKKSPLNEANQKGGLSATKEPSKKEAISSKPSTKEALTKEVAASEATPQKATAKHAAPKAVDKETKEASTKTPAKEVKEPTTSPEGQAITSIHLPHQPEPNLAEAKGQVQEVPPSNGTHSSPADTRESKIGLDDVIGRLAELRLEAVHSRTRLRIPGPFGIVYEGYDTELQLPLMQRLIEKDLSEPYSVFTYRYFLNNWPNLCFLAMKDDLCVGTIICKLGLDKKGLNRGYIAMLAVDSSLRKMGIGSTLVKLCIEQMKAKNCDVVVLETELTNTGALALYDKLDFVRDKRLMRYYLNGVDAFRLKLWLTSPTGYC